MRLTKPVAWRVLLTSTAALCLLMGAGPLLLHSGADKLPNRSLRLGNPQQGAVTDYTITFDIPASSPLGSMRFRFCSDTPLLDQPCTAPAGLDVSGASLSTQTGATGFSIAAGTDANDIVLSRPAQLAGPGTVSYSFAGVQNPSAEGTYFARLQTFASTDASGADTDNGGIAYVINGPISISTTVPPYLLLCTGLAISNYDCATATGDYINFGELSSKAAKTGTTQLVLATNAANGYGVYLDGSTMASGTDVITPLGSSDVSRPGVSQFGINLAANTSPTVGAAVAGPGTGLPTSSYALADRYRFVPGDQIISAPGANDFRKYTVSYIVNVPADQAPGIYVSTITYVAVADF